MNPLTTDYIDCFCTVSTDNNFIFYPKIILIYFICQWNNLLCFFKRSVVRNSEIHGRISVVYLCGRGKGIGSSVRCLLWDSCGTANKAASCGAGFWSEHWFIKYSWSVHVEGPLRTTDLTLPIQRRPLNQTADLLWLWAGRVWWSRTFFPCKLQSLPEPNQ